MTNLETLSQIPQTKSFIGSEFLTWLWFLTESQEMPVLIDCPRTGKSFNLNLWVDDRVVLESTTSHVHTNTLKGGSPSQSPEAQAALKTGKLVKQIRIGADITGIGEILFTLESKDLSPRTVRIIEDTPEDTENESLKKIEQRIIHLEALSEIIDSLFSKFVNSRLKKEWFSQDLPEIHLWIENKNPAGSTLIN